MAVLGASLSEIFRMTRFGSVRLVERFRQFRFFGSGGSFREERCSVVQHRLTERDGSGLSSEKRFRFRRFQFRVRFGNRLQRFWFPVPVQFLGHMDSWSDWLNGFDHGGSTGGGQLALTLDGRERTSYTRMSKRAIFFNSLACRGLSESKERESMYTMPLSIRIRWIAEMREPLDFRSVRLNASVSGFATLEISSTIYRAQNPESPKSFKKVSREEFQTLGPRPWTPKSRAPKKNQSPKSPEKLKSTTFLTFRPSFWLFRGLGSGGPKLLAGDFFGTFRGLEVLGSVDGGGDPKTTRQNLSPTQGCTKVPLAQDCRRVLVIAMATCWSLQFPCMEEGKEDWYASSWETDADTRLHPKDPAIQKSTFGHINSPRCCSKTQRQCSKILWQGLWNALFSWGKKIHRNSLHKIVNYYGDSKLLLWSSNPFFFLEKSKGNSKKQGFFSKHKKGKKGKKAKKAKKQKTKNEKTKQKGKGNRKTKKRKEIEKSKERRVRVHRSIFNTTGSSGQCLEGAAFFAVRASTLCWRWAAKSAAPSKHWCSSLIKARTASMQSVSGRHEWRHLF